MPSFTALERDVITTYQLCNGSCWRVSDRLDLTTKQVKQVIGEIRRKYAHHGRMGGRFVKNLILGIKLAEGENTNG